MIASAAVMVIPMATMDHDQKGWQDYDGRKNLHRVDQYNIVHIYPYALLNCTIQGVRRGNAHLDSTTRARSNYAMRMASDRR